MNKDIQDNLHDPNWRLTNLYDIVDKNESRVRFSPNLIQKIINNSPSKRKIVLKARQFGVSTNEIIKLFDYVIWNQNATACILAHEQDAIKKLFRIVKRAHKFLHPDLRPEVDRGGGSKYEMFFPKINSLIYCDLQSRGDTISRLHVSEAAFMEKSNLDATLQAVPLHGHVTIETTVNGMGNFFYKMWNNPVTESVYEKMFFPWFFFPEYQIPIDQISYTEDEINFIGNTLKYFNKTITPAQINYRRFKKAELGDLFIQEYPEDDESCFLSSGNPVMNLVQIKRMKKAAKKPIIDHGHFKVFETVKTGHQYVIGADTAEGVRGDFSVGVIFDIGTREEVAIIRSNDWSPGEFAQELYNLGNLYVTHEYWPILAVERNNHGHAVLLKLDEILNYPRIYKYKEDKNGWQTDKVTRPIMLDTFIEGVQNETIILNSADVYTECLTLINNSGKIEAADNEHDDCIIAASIATQVVIEHASNLSVYENIHDKIRM